MAIISNLCEAYHRQPYKIVGRNTSGTESGHEVAIRRFSKVRHKIRPNWYSVLY